MFDIFFNSCGNGEINGDFPVNYLLEYLAKSNKYDFILFGVFEDDKMKKNEIKNVSLVKILS